MIGHDLADSISTVAHFLLSESQLLQTIMGWTLRSYPLKMLQSYSATHQVGCARSCVERGKEKRGRLSDSFKWAKDRFAFALNG